MMSFFDIFILIFILFIASSASNMSSPAFLFLMWFLIQLLMFAWGGLRKLLSIILLPGAFLHTLAHRFASFMLNKKYPLSGSTYTYFKFGLTGEFSALLEKKPYTIRDSILFALAPFPFAVVGLITSLLLGSLFLLPFGTFGMFIWVWLSLSIVVMGMPSIDDIVYIINTALVERVLTIFLILYSVVVFGVGTYVFGWVPAFLLTLLFLILIIYVSAEEKTIGDVHRARLKSRKMIGLADLEMILQE